MLIEMQQQSLQTHGTDLFNNRGQAIHRLSMYGVLEPYPFRRDLRLRYSSEGFRMNASQNPFHDKTCLWQTLPRQGLRVIGSPIRLEYF